MQAAWDADLDTLLIAREVALDDHIIPAYRAAAGRARRLGRPQVVTDAELICLAVAQVLLRHHDQRHWLRADAIRSSAPQVVSEPSPRPG